MSFSLAESVVPDVVAQLRASLTTQEHAGEGNPLGLQASLETAIGNAAATPAFPFDVVAGPEVFAKSTILVVDVDSVVLECVRVQRWCAHEQRTQRAGGTAGQDVAETVDKAVRTPSLTSLLLCYLRFLRGVMAKQRVQVEMILGNCDSALAELAAMRRGVEAEERAAPACCAGESSPPVRRGETSGASPPLTTLAPSAQAIEESHVWLQIYQVILLFFKSAGGDVVELTSLLTTAKPAWAVAVARLDALLGGPTAQNLQLFPLLWSTDSRAFFAAAGKDALVSSWVVACRDEVAVLCGRPLPDSLCQPGAVVAAAPPPSSLLLPPVARVLAARLLVRHSACTARHLGLRSATFLPTLFALLACLPRQPRPKSNGPGEAAREPASVAAAHEAPSGVPPLSSLSLREAVGTGAKLVNASVGVLTTELVEQWAAATGQGESAVPLAILLWQAQTALDDVTARGVTLDRHTRTVWAARVWQWRGPPPIPPAMSATAALLDDPSAAQEQAGADGAGVVPVPRVYAELRPLRTRLLGALERLFGSSGSGASVWGAEAASGADSGAALCRAFGRSVQGSCILADSQVAAAGDGGSCAFQTRPSLDEVREHMRPAAQLTVVALTLLWRLRLWREADCMRFLVFFLAFADAEEHGAAWGGPLAAAAAPTAPADHHASLCVDEDEVAEWWHALSCVAVLQSMSTSAPPPAAGAAAAALRQADATSDGGPLCDPGSVLVGCLPTASYAPADVEALRYFLISRGLLCRGRSGVTADAAAAVVAKDTATRDGSARRALLSAEELTALLRQLRCPPSLTNEIVFVHAIWTRLDSALIDHAE